MAEFTVAEADWQRDNAALCRIRRTVFIDEQQVPEALEWDGLDAAAVHLLARDAQGNPIGTARMLADGHIGRVAVLADWRRHGVGSALLRQLLQIAEARRLAPNLDAQIHAIGFYERFGFRATGEAFLDAGIPHRHMIRQA